MNKKMILKNRIITYTLAVVLMAIMMIIPKVDVSADTYNGADKALTKKWDIDGDGKKESIKFTPTGYDEGYGGAQGIKLYVDGKQQIYIKQIYFHSYSYKFIKLKNNQRYLFLNLHGDNDDTISILICCKKNGTLKEEVNIGNQVGFSGYHFSVTFPKVTENKIVFKTHSMSQVLGAMNFKTVYTYKSGKLKLESKTHKIYGYLTMSDTEYKVHSLTTSKSIKIYKDKKGKTYKTTLKKGKKAKITKCYITSKYTSYYVKGIGWFKIKNNSSMENPLFEELFFAG